MWLWVNPVGVVPSWIRRVSCHYAIVSSWVHNFFSWVFRVWNKDLKKVCCFSRSETSDSLNWRINFGPTKYPQEKTLDLRSAHEKSFKPTKFWTHEKKFPTKTHKIPTRRHFGPTKYLREKILNSRNTHDKKISDSWNLAYPLPTQETEITL